jgi:predicted nucleic acid-binding protein
VRRFLYDTAVFVYALGRDHQYREPCRQIIDLARAGHLAGEASVELIQEFLHVRTRGYGNRECALREARAVAQLCRLHPFTEAELRLSWSLFAAWPKLQSRDAVHAATALNHDVAAIVSPDRASLGSSASTHWTRPSG